MATTAVLKYLKSTNRPYSANDIVQNMHKEHGKTAVQKALDDLVAQDHVCEKVYGKQKIYCIKQSEDDAMEENELKDLESEVDQITENCKNVEQQLKETENAIRTLMSNPTNKEAKEQLTSLEKTVEALRLKLSKLSQNTIVVSPEEKNKISSDHATLLKEYRKRKRLCMDVVNAIMEGYPKSKASLLEEVGIETDEEVKMPLILSP